MLAPFLKDSEWVKRRLALIHQHHSEWIKCLKLEKQSWQAMEYAHRRQVIKLAIPSLSEEAKLTRKQTQDIAEWLKQKIANRQAMKVRQSEEIAALEQQR